MHDAAALPLSLAMFCFGLAGFMTLTSIHTRTHTHTTLSWYLCLAFYLQKFHSHFGILEGAEFIAAGRNFHCFAACHTQKVFNFIYFSFRFVKGKHIFLVPTVIQINKLFSWGNWKSYKTISSINRHSSLFSFICF